MPGTSDDCLLFLLYDQMFTGVGGWGGQARPCPSRSQYRATIVDLAQYRQGKENAALSVHERSQQEFDWGDSPNHVLSMRDGTWNRLHILQVPNGGAVWQAILGQPVLPRLLMMCHHRALLCHQSKVGTVMQYIYFLLSGVSRQQTSALTSHLSDQKLSDSIPR